MAHRTAAIWTLLVLIVLIAATTLFWVGRGAEDPALTRPGEGGGQQTDP